MANHDLTREDISALINLIAEEVDALEGVVEYGDDGEPIRDSTRYWEGVRAKLWTLASSRPVNG